MADATKGLTVKDVVVGVPVGDIDAATKWYQQWIGREPDVTPAPGIVEWQLNAGAWIQLDGDKTAGGPAIVALGVPDLDDARAVIDALGIELGPVHEVPGAVRYCEFRDPDGNRLHLVAEWAQ